MPQMDLKGPILANTVYIDGELVAKDVAFNLPAVNFVSADFRAMGTMEMPIIGQIEAMETTITRIGVDLGLCKAVRIESKVLECRFVQDVKKPDGTTKVEGCKAFLRVSPKGIPALSVDPGATVESELAFATSRYQLFVAGKEQWLIDQLSQILRIDGKNYYEEISSLL